MLVTFEKLIDISTAKLSFYTVKFKNQELNEYRKFCQKDFPDHKVESQILEKSLQKMGLRGAKPYYFVYENGAFKLPIVSPETKKANRKDFGLRLYGIHLCESIVILLNGGIKTVSTSAQHCPNISQFFNHAVSLETKIRRAIQEDFARLNGLNLEFDEDFVIDI